MIFGLNPPQPLQGGDYWYFRFHFSSKVSLYEQILNIHYHHECDTSQS